MTDHLAPEDSPFETLPIIATYYAAVYASLTPKAERKLAASASVICLPSCETEWMLTLARSQNGDYTSIATTADEPIWPNMGDPVFAISRHDCGMKPELGTKLHRLFHAALRGVRFPDAQEVGLDGVNYHFTYFDRPTNHMAGKAWTPSTNTLPGKLAELSHGLYDGTRREQLAVSSVEQQLRSLLKWFDVNLPTVNW